MSKIVIRADGGKNIGMGHIMRTLVLAKELSKTNEVIYACKTNENCNNNYMAGIEKIKSEGFEIKLLNEKFYLQELVKIHGNCLITDSYEVDEEYFKYTKSLFHKTGYIDDMNLYYFDVDFIINQNIGTENWKYKANSNTRLMLGSNYTMLREEFRKKISKPEKKEVENILITLGGADPYNTTEKILKYLHHLNYKFQVVVGPSFSNVKELQRMEGGNIILHYNAEMWKVMAGCETAISACGSTLYELAACNIPTIGIITAENQSAVAENMDNKGLIINLGYHNKLTKDILCDRLIKICEDLTLREKMVEMQKRSININGVEKICKEIKELINLE